MSDYTWDSSRETFLDEDGQPVAYIVLHIVGDPSEDECEDMSDALQPIADFLEEYKFIFSDSAVFTAGVDFLISQLRDPYSLQDYSRLDDGDAQFEFRLTDAKIIDMEFIRPLYGTIVGLITNPLLHAQIPGEGGSRALAVQLAGKLDALIDRGTDDQMKAFVISG